MDGRHKRRFRALYGEVRSRNGVRFFGGSDLSLFGGREGTDDMKEGKDKIQGGKVDAKRKRTKSRKSPGINGEKGKEFFYYYRI
ncbi:MAG: hypothetical protein ACE5IH_03360 [Thermodesulfobacteriota bacterium]